MVRLRSWGFSALIGLAAHSAAAAPPVPTKPANEPTAQVEAARPDNTGPTFWVLGIPVRLSAPVPPAYDGTAYKELGGQPMSGVDQVMSQQFTDQK
jgi:hypothetical protein